MCGLAGEIRFDGQTPDLGAIARMNAIQTPRGPDAAGVFAQGNIAFGHRRLKIIDVSEHSQQPMVDNALGLAAVYNGAIYNYRELRGELEQLGYSFFSEGDTEVILKAYHAWGEDFVQRLNGMFAFAIRERDSGRLLLGRDRLGIKPLYYCELPGALRFASSLPALLAAGEVDTRVDPAALHHYLNFHAVVPAPLTILRGVRKLPPATLMRVEADGKRHERRFWSLDFAPGDNDPQTLQDWQQLTLDTLRTSVKRRLVADVPVGVLLSGGLDSSLIVGLLAEAGQHGLNTFSVGFESVNEERGDEFQYSDLIAEHYSTRHHQIVVDTQRMLPALSDCIRAMNEPMVSHDAVGFYLLSHEVAKHVKVVQSGQGADEVFGGYHWYPPLTDSQDAVADYSRVFRDRDAAEYSATVQPGWDGEDVSGAFIRDHFAAPGAATPVDQALRIDTTIMLVDDPVKRVDNMTMAHGLEARVPFLDHELVELAARIPAPMKIAGEGKHVLKEAAREVIPHGVIDRPKGYFPVPALKYLRGPYLDFARDALFTDAARDRGLFRRDYVDKLLADPEAHITPLRGSKLWQLSLLEHWLQTHLPT